MFPPSRPRGGPRRSLIPVLLLLTILIPSVALAQAIPDPCLSEVQILCDNIHFSPPWGFGDPLGDVGLLVVLRDGDGLPIEGVPPEAFAVRAPGPPWSLAVTDSSELGTLPTDEEGRILLTRRLQAVGNAVDAPLLVRVTVDEFTVDLDCNVNGSASFVTPDVNGDGVVSIADLHDFATCMNPPNYCVEADLNGNGEMDLGDQAIFMRYILGSPPKGDIRISGASRPTKTGESLFVGCLQRDFDDDGSPATILDSLLVIPGEIYELKLLAKDFLRLSAVEFSLDLPPGTLLAPGACVVAEPPFSLGAAGAQGCGSTNLPPTALTIGANPCLESGPIFVATVNFMSSVPQWLHTVDFLLSGTLSDCSPRPTGVEACIGTPTPCEVSSLDIGTSSFVTCPGGDLDLTDTITLTLRDQNGSGVPGVGEDAIMVSIEDQLGSNEGDRFQLIALAAETDAEGRLDYRFEPRETCRWDGCFDLLIEVRLEGCELSTLKRIRTLNLVRFEDDPGALDEDVISVEDELALDAMIGTVDPCGDLYGLYRCSAVLPAYLSLLREHTGHSCSVTAAPDPIPSRWSRLEQNVPNPFNPRTRIRVALRRPAADAVLEVYTLDGRFVRRLWSGELPEGETDFQWDGTDAHRSAVASGVYVARLVTEESRDSIRMVLLR